MRITRQILTSTPLFWVAMLGWVIFLAGYFWPASAWLDVRSVSAGPAHAGEEIPMTTDREIKRGFTASWAVSVRRWEPGTGMVSFCRATGTDVYNTAAQLPPKLTLGWWTNGQCGRLPAGRYEVETAWQITPHIPLVPTKHVRISSNIFEVTP